jgi:hypothetical protein
LRLHGNALRHLRRPAAGGETASVACAGNFPVSIQRRVGLLRGSRAAGAGRNRTSRCLGGGQKALPQNWRLLACEIDAKAQLLFGERAAHNRNSLIQISAAVHQSVHCSRMKRVELLKARIALYRRYLREGADGDIARTYLWLIRKDEIELTAIVAESHRNEPKTDTDSRSNGSAGPEKPKNG